MNPDLPCTPPEVREIANNAIQKLLPIKSRAKYEKEYKNFLTWCSDNKVENISENAILAYFQNMSETKKASTMWSNYSMLRTCLSIYKNIDISKFLKLAAFLKRQSGNYQPKKSQILESEDITKFIIEADDNIFLAMKVGLIMGYCGACRRDELTNMTLKDVDVQSDKIMVTLPKTKNNVSRIFFITDVSWITLINKYIQLRPPHISHNRFFLTYRNGKCTTSPIGINKIGEMPKSIARFLKLPNPEKYTGHCFRRSSASHLANQGGDLLTIKKHGGWKSSAVAEGYVDASLKKKVEVAQQFTSQNNPKASTSTARSPTRIETESSHDGTVLQNQNILLSQQSGPPVSISASGSATVTVKIYNHCTINEN